MKQINALPAFAALLSVSVILSGCATPSELREKGPALVLKSRHDAKRVSACIADKWENAVPFFGTQPVHLKLLKDGYSVAAGNEGTSYLVDVRDSPDGGSTTNFYKYRETMIKPFDPPVTICQSE